MNWMRPTDSFYGKYAPIFSNLFEVLYLCVTCVAPAVAFATGGATLSALTVYLNPEMSRQSVLTVFMVQMVAAFLVDRLINSIIIYFIEQ